MAAATPARRLPQEYSFTEAAKIAFAATFYRGIQRIAYEKLLPLGYRVYQLKNFDSLAPSDRGRPPNVPQWYRCEVAHPFYNFPALAFAHCSSPWAASTSSTCLVLSAPPGSFEVHGTPPPDPLP